MKRDRVQLQNNYTNAIVSELFWCQKYRVFAENTTRHKKNHNAHTVSINIHSDDGRRGSPATSLLRPPHVQGVL